MRKYLIAGNWKMNTTISDAEELINAVNSGLQAIGDIPNIEVLVCPPFVSIYVVNEFVAPHGLIKVGAQNCYYEPKGAFTGEISIAMLKATGCEYVIIGHSERRAIFGESNELINKKLKAILKAGITPILCIGETLADRNQGRTFDVLKEQLDGCLKDVEIDMVAKIVIAYEPVWAIGTGVSATSIEVAEAHTWLRDYLVNRCGDFIAKCVYLLYGGSLSDTNAKETLSIENVDGGLIGGAALIADKFLSIIETAKDISNSQGHKPPCSCGC